MSMHMRLLLTTPHAPAWKVALVWVALGRRMLVERPLWAAVMVGLLALIIAYQSPRSLFVDVGGALESVHLEGFYDPETSSSATFRWSSGRSVMQFPGLGKPLAPMRIDLQLSGGPRPGPGTAVLHVAANGHSLPPLTLSPQSQPYILTVPPEWIGPSGDLRLDFSVPTFRAPNDRRDLGFMVDFVRISLPVGATVPSLTTTLWLVLCSALAYLLLRGAWLAPVPSALVVGVCLLACAGIVAVHRLLVTLFVDRLAAALVLALLAGIIAEVLVRAIVEAAGWKGERALPEWAWAGLRGLVMTSVALKVGGVLHPLSFIIDAPFHLRYIQYMAEGRYEYFGEALAFAVMPKEEWGSARAFIPYSPFFYVVAAPLTRLPVPLELSVPTISALFESFKIALVFMIGLALGRPSTQVGAPDTANARQALASAAFYALMPATFLLQQWGNWPTQASLWLLTLWVAFTCLFWSSITRPWVWALSTTMLTLTMLSYTVTAAYTGVFVGMVVVGGWLFAPADRRRWGAVALCLLASVALAMLIYYGQYLAQIIRETLPTFGQAIQEQGKLTTLRPSVWSFLSDHLGRAMQSYHLALVYALGLSGALWAFFSPRFGGSLGPVVGTTKPSHTCTWQNVWLAAWLMVFLLVTLADFWMDQALKEFWYALPAVAVAGGMWVVTVWSRRSRLRMFVWLLAFTLAWQALSLWVFRLFFHNR